MLPDLKRLKQENVSILSSLIDSKANVLMTVPTPYAQLIQKFDQLAHIDQEHASGRLAAMRLFVSGSAALSEPAFKRWRVISTHSILERYGMSEVGMALSNPYRGERVASSVGFPLPSVDCAIMTEDRLVMVDENTDAHKTYEGVLHLKGPSVFRGYWGREDNFKQSIREDGTFATGDQVRLTQGRCYILGRDGRHVFKSEGEKVSALKVENAIQSSFDGFSCAVVGIDAPCWGQRVVCAVEMEGDRETTLPHVSEVKKILKTKLANFEVPKNFVVMKRLPRNALGKIQKEKIRAIIMQSVLTEGHDCWHPLTEVVK